MTIAKTGNSIVDRAARQGAARAKFEESKSKASAKIGAARARTGRGAKAGRTAIKNSKGRGVAGSSHKNRAGAEASIQYAINKPDARFVSSNAGLNSKDIAANFRLAQSSRPDIIKDTGHISFSLPADEKLSDQRWAMLADRARAELGLDDGFPYVLGVHEDTGHQHGHITYSRVSYNGRVHDDRFLKLRIAAVEDVLEMEFKLKITPKEDFAKAPRYTISEAAMAAKTGVQPPRIVIDTLIREALASKPNDPQAFIKRLATYGVIARPAIKGEKMSGFSFQYEGIEFGASKISNEFGWKKLQEKINYVAHRDDAQLADLAARLPAKPEAEDVARQPIGRGIKETNNQLPKFEQPTFGGTEEKPKPQATTRKHEVTEVRSNNCNFNNDHDAALPLRRKRSFNDIFREKCFPTRWQVIDRIKTFNNTAAQPEQRRLATTLIGLIEKNDFASGAVKIFLKEENGGEAAKKMVLDFVQEVRPDIVQQCCAGIEVRLRLEQKAQTAEMTEDDIIITEQADEYQLPELKF